jgi:hypothetical protein
MPLTSISLISSITYFKALAEVAEKSTGINMVLIGIYLVFYRLETVLLS